MGAHSRNVMDAPGYHPVFDIPPSSALYEAAVEGLTRVNEEIMRRMDIPKLYDSGAVYKRIQKHGQPHKWLHAADVAQLGYGVCEDLAAYRAAELRVSGDDPSAFVFVYRSGPKMWHAVVKRGDGSIEDPSRALGMGAGKDDDMAISGDDKQPNASVQQKKGTSRLVWDPVRKRWVPAGITSVRIKHPEGWYPGKENDDAYYASEEARAAAKQAHQQAMQDYDAGDGDDGSDGGYDYGDRRSAYREDERQLMGDCYIGEDPTPDLDHPTWTSERCDGGYRGHVRIPMVTGNAVMVQSAPAPSRQAAIQDAMKQASKALDSPEAQALLPPQAKLALNIMRSPLAQDIAKSILGLL